MDKLDELKNRLAKEPVIQRQALMDTSVASIVKLSTQELRLVVEESSNPSCPICRAFAKACLDRRDEEILAVDRVDLQAVLEGGKVIVDISLVDGRRVKTKRLESPTSKPKPKPAKKPSEKAEGKP